MILVGQEKGMGIALVVGIAIGSLVEFALLLVRIISRLRLEVFIVGIRVVCLMG